jgi:2-oxoacid:acceptor oxidoreductase gamma subunit (pyruvate/2-ketoisovalerate family)
MMHENLQQMIEIRWHGRGGQGAITAAKVVAEAMFKSGYGGVVMAPTFGTERRGAPVSTSLKVSREKIYDLSPIRFPDIVVVLDHLILAEVDVTVGLKPGGLLVLNSPRPASEHQLADFRVAVANVTKLGIEAGLRKGIVNSGIIGALGRASGLVGIEILTRCIADEFSGRKPEENARAAQLVYAATEICEPSKGALYA